MATQPGVGYTFTTSSQGENFNVIEQWSPLTPIQYDVSVHPFKIVRASIVASNVRFQVVSGSINNLVPVIDDISGSKVKLNRVTAGIPDPPTCELSAGNYDSVTKTSYIVLRAGPSTSTGDYPDTDDTTNRYPVIIGGNTATPVDLDTWGFIIIGSITVDDISAPTTITVSQNVTGSLWADRLKLGTLTAKYYYARI